METSLNELRKLARRLFQAVESIHPNWVSCDCRGYMEEARHPDALSRDSLQKICEHLLGELKQFVKDIPASTAAYKSLAKRVQMAFRSDTNDPVVIKRRRGEAKEFSRSFVVTLEVPVTMTFDKAVTPLPKGLRYCLAEEVKAHAAVYHQDPDELVHYITEFKEI